MFLSPAKINLFLHIVGRREDGYHLLQSVFLLIGLCDEIDIHVRGDGKILRTKDLTGISEKEDLAMRAAVTLKKYIQEKIPYFPNVNNLGAQISISKKIPMGAGLGGGSSNAATVLLALNKLWNVNVSNEELQKIGLSLGADVPFFIFGKNAFVEGVGEKFSEINIEPTKLAVMVPPINIPTVEIFTSNKLKRNHKKVSIAEVQSESLVNNCFAGEKWKNSLQATALEYAPKLAIYRQKWAEQWQINNVFDIKMSGSGSGFFYMLTKKQLMLYNSPPFFDEENVSFWSGDSLEKHPLKI